MVVLSSKSYTFDPRPDYPLLSTAKRYWDPNSATLDDPTALTLIFAHGTGFHKEQWEPTIEDLYQIMQPGNLKVRDVWAIDAPNHGDAAVLNEDVLKVDYEPIFRWDEYARSLFHFLTGFGTGVDVNFAERRLIGIGHSMGANCLLLSQTYGPSLKFEAVVLVELMSVSRQAMGKPSQALLKGAVNRRDAWDTKEEAYHWMKARPAWKIWDDRVLRRFIDFGLRPLSTGVTLKCTKDQEAACYRDNSGPFRPYEVIREFTKRHPIHMIYGSINDYMPEEVKEDVVNNAVGGRQNLASYRRVAGAGHLAPQMNPRGVAQAIYEALTVSSKL